MLGTEVISTLVRVVAVWKTPFIGSYLWLVLSLVSRRNMTEIWYGNGPISTSAQVHASQANVYASRALCSQGKNVNRVSRGASCQWEDVVWPMSWIILSCVCNTVCILALKLGIFWNIFVFYCVNYTRKAQIAIILLTSVSACGYKGYFSLVKQQYDSYEIGTERL